jgi:hypothetical protein
VPVTTVGAAVALLADKKPKNKEIDTVARQ